LYWNIPASSPLDNITHQIPGVLLSNSLHEMLMSTCYWETRAGPAGGKGAGKSGREMRHGNSGMETRPRRSNTLQDFNTHSSHFMSGSGSKPSNMDSYSDPLVPASGADQTANSMDFQDDGDFVVLPHQTALPMSSAPQGAATPRELISPRSPFASTSSAMFGNSISTLFKRRKSGSSQLSVSTPIHKVFSRSTGGGNGMTQSRSSSNLLGKRSTHAPLQGTSGSSQLHHTFGSSSSDGSSSNSQQMRLMKNTTLLKLLKIIQTDPHALFNKTTQPPPAVPSSRGVGGLAGTSLSGHGEGVLHRGSGSSWAPPPGTPEFEISIGRQDEWDAAFEREGGVGDNAFVLQFQPRRDVENISNWTCVGDVARCFHDVFLDASSVGGLGLWRSDARQALAASARLRRSSLPPASWDEQDTIKDTAVQLRKQASQTLLLLHHKVWVRQWSLSRCPWARFWTVAMDLQCVLANVVVELTERNFQARVLRRPDGSQKAPAKGRASSRLPPDSASMVMVLAVIRDILSQHNTLLRHICHSEDGSDEGDKPRSSSGEYHDQAQGDGGMDRERAHRKERDPHAATSPRPVVMTRVEFFGADWDQSCAPFTSLLQQRTDSFALLESVLLVCLSDLDHTMCKLATICLGLLCEQCALIHSIEEEMIDLSAAAPPPGVASEFYPDGDNHVSLADLNVFHFSPTINGDMYCELRDSLMFKPGGSMNDSLASLSRVAQQKVIKNVVGKHGVCSAGISMAWRVLYGRWKMYAADVLIDVGASSGTSSTEGEQARFEEWKNVTGLLFSVGSAFMHMERTRRANDNDAAYDHDEKGHHTGPKSTSASSSKGGHRDLESPMGQGTFHSFEIADDLDVGMYQMEKFVKEFLDLLLVCKQEHWCCIRDVVASSIGSHLGPRILAVVMPNVQALMHDLHLISSCEPSVQLHSIQSVRDRILSSIHEDSAEDNQGSGDVGESMASFDPCGSSNSLFAKSLPLSSLASAQAARDDVSASQSFLGKFTTSSNGPSLGGRDVGAGKQDTSFASWRYIAVVDCCLTILRTILEHLSSLQRPPAYDDENIDGATAAEARRPSLKLRRSEDDGLLLIGNFEPLLLGMAKMLSNFAMPTPSFVSKDHSKTSGNGDLHSVATAAMDAVHKDGGSGAEVHASASMNAPAPSPSNKQNDNLMERRTQHLLGARKKFCRVLAIILETRGQHGSDGDGDGESSDNCGLDQPADVHDTESLAALNTALTFADEGVFWNNMAEHLFDWLSVSELFLIRKMVHKSRRDDGGKGGGTHKWMPHGAGSDPSSHMMPDAGGQARNRMDSSDSAFDMRRNPSSAFSVDGNSVDGAGDMFGDMLMSKG
jgi:hypothetical protein